MNRIEEIQFSPNTLRAGDKTISTDNRVDILELYQEKNGGILNTADVSAAIYFARESGKTSDLLSEAFKQIRQAGNFLVVADELRKHMNTSGPNGVIRDVLSEEWSANLNELVAGTYTRNENKIRIAKDHPSDSETLKSLATKGAFPDAVLTRIHEGIHALQFNLFAAESAPQELIEAQAYRGAGGKRSEMSEFDLVRTILNSGIYPDIDEEKLEYAIYSIDRLNALGFTQAQIAYRIAIPDLWDDNECVWDNMENFLESSRMQRGLDQSDLERAVVRYRNRNSIEKYRARKITQHILYDAFGKEIEEDRLDRETFFEKTVPRFLEKESA